MTLPKSNLRGLLAGKGLDPVGQFMDQDLSGFFAKVFNPDNTMKLPELSNTAAPNKTLYWSITGSKAAIKDATGTVHYLW